MIRPTRSYLHDLQVPFLSAPLFHLPPEKLQYCNIIAYFSLLILFLVYYCRDVTWEKKEKSIVHLLNLYTSQHHLINRQKGMSCSCMYHY